MVVVEEVLYAFPLCLNLYGLLVGSIDPLNVSLVYFLTQNPGFFLRRLPKPSFSEPPNFLIGLKLGINGLAKLLNAGASVDEVAPVSSISSAVKRSP